MGAYGIRLQSGLYYTYDFLLNSTVVTSMQGWAWKKDTAFRLTLAKKLHFRNVRKVTFKHIKITKILRVSPLTARVNWRLE